MRDHAEDVTAERPELPQQWACTRQQLTAAIMAYREADSSGEHVNRLVSERLADAILGRLPSLGAGIAAVSQADLRAILADAFAGASDHAAWNRLAEAAGLTEGASRD